MSTRSLALVTALVAALLAAPAFAADIVTVPTANQLAHAEVDLGYYHIELDAPREMPQWVRVQTLFVGISESLELDAHRYDQDHASDDTIWNLSYKLMDESLVMPDVVVGARDIASVMASTSYYVSAAKTLTSPSFGPATKPIIRGHLSLGTSDNSLLGETRHDGFFGGVQVIMRMKPRVELVALHDGADLVTGITYKPSTYTPTLKAGGFGDHWWVGISYTIRPPGA